MAPPRAQSLLLAVLAARYIRILSTAPSNHAWLWHQALPDTETELELGQLLPSKQAPGDRVVEFGFHVTRSPLSSLLRGPGQTPKTLSGLW